MDPNQAVSWLGWILGAGTFAGFVGLAALALNRR